MFGDVAETNKSNPMFIDGEDDTEVEKSNLSFEKP